jgi:ferrous iron transport protein B
VASGAPLTGPPGEAADTPRILIAGNPNGGKTTLFNALTGARARVSNYPGVTVTRRSGRLRLPGGGLCEVVDLPGTYSLSARSREEQIAADALLGRRAPRPDGVVIVADATTLARGLYLTLQVIETGVSAVLALNVMDEARQRGLEIDVEALSRELGVPVVPTVASRGEGREALIEAIARLPERPADSAEPAPLPAPLAEDVARVEAALPAAAAGRGAANRRAWALWALLSVDEDDELEGVDPELRATVREVRARAAEQGRELDGEIVAARYARIDALLLRALRGGSEAPRLTERLDRVLTHRVSGFLIFVAVMLVVFQALFAWAEPAMGFIEERVADLQLLASAVLPEGPLRSLLVDGVIAGVGNVVVFVPQIALLFLSIAFLEDSGYLARVAFVIDRMMGGVGLHGKAFVPMLSGFACAIPAVMATRTIESRRDRLLTMLVLPLMSCSARLPVYVLITATVFEAGRPVLGFLSAGALALLSLYLLSVAAALASAAVLRRTLLRGPRPALVLELPPYRMPQPRNLMLSTWQPVRRFLIEAGTIILSLTIVLWALLSYPNDPDSAARFAAERTRIAEQAPGAEREARLAALADREAGAQLRHSVMGRLGHLIEPALEPMGQDWRVGIGILGAFAAREVFVSTLGIVFDIGDADEASAPLRQELQQATWPDGRPLMTPLSGTALLVFFVLACQCMSTIAIVRRESGSWGWALFMFAYMSVLAYAAAVGVYQGGRLLGLGA